MDHIAHAPEQHSENTVKNSPFAAEIAASGYDTNKTFFSNGNPINFSQDRQIVVSPYPGHKNEEWHYTNGGGCLGAANPSSSIVMDKPTGEVSLMSNRFNQDSPLAAEFPNADLRNMNGNDMRRLSTGDSRDPEAEALDRQHEAEKVREQERKRKEALAHPAPADAEETK